MSGSDIISFMLVAALGDLSAQIREKPEEMREVMVEAFNTPRHRWGRILVTCSGGLQCTQQCLQIE